MATRVRRQINQAIKAAGQEAEQAAADRAAAAIAQPGTLPAAQIQQPGLPPAVQSAVAGSSDGSTAGSAADPDPSAPFPWGVLVIGAAAAALAFFFLHLSWWVCLLIGLVVTFAAWRFVMSRTS